MSDALFPANLPGLAIKVERRVVWPNVAHRSPTGKRTSASWRSTPLVRYTLSFEFLRGDVNAPSPNQAYTELAFVEWFYNAHRGQDGDSFKYVDPQTGVEQRVTFASELRYAKDAEGVWVVDSVEMETV